MFNIKSLFNKSKECWKYKKCKTELRNKCPAYLDNKTNECWEIEGTLCDGLTQNEFSRKLKDCTNCDYYIVSAWGLDPTEAHKNFVKDAVRKAREKNAKIFIEKILTDCVRRFKEAASVKKIKIELNIPPELTEHAGNLGTFYGNQEELSHVLLHFISKSLTYSKPESTIYLRADDLGDSLKIGIIYSSILTGPLLDDEKESSENSKEKREIVSEQIISNYAGKCWEEINPVGRSGLFFTVAKDRRAAKNKIKNLSFDQSSNDRRL